MTQGFLLDRGRETIATSPLDAEPNLILEMPADSTAPFVVALGLTVVFTGAAVHRWWVVGGGFALIVIGLVMWFWPRRIHEDEPAAPLAQGAARG